MTACCCLVSPHVSRFALPGCLRTTSAVVLSCMCIPLFHMSPPRVVLPAGGLPDLLLWRPSDCSAKLVEVKGPRDRLSHQQRFWLAHMANNTMQVCVCVWSRGWAAQTLECGMCACATGQYTTPLLTACCNPLCCVLWPCGAQVEVLKVKEPQQGSKRK